MGPMAVQTAFRPPRSRKRYWCHTGSPSCPSGATSSMGTPRPPTRSKPSWPRRWPPREPTPRPPPGPWSPGSAMRSYRTTRSKPTAATSWTSLRHMQAQGVSPLEVIADHVKLYKRALLEAGRTSATVAPAALSLARHLPSARRQGDWSPGRPPRTSPRSRHPQSRRTRRRL